MRKVLELKSQLRDVTFAMLKSNICEIATGYIANRFILSLKVLNDQKVIVRKKKQQTISFYRFKTQSHIVSLIESDGDLKSAVINNEFIHTCHLIILIFILNRRRVFLRKNCFFATSSDFFQYSMINFTNSCFETIRKYNIYCNLPLIIEFDSKYN